MFGGRGADVVNGGDGNDEIRGNKANDTIADVVNGGPGDDVLRGRRGAGTIDGGPGDDVVRGGRGADALDGGAGIDVCVGGGGSTPLSRVKRLPVSPSWPRLAAVVLVVALVVGACANPVDKRRAEELGADPILVAPDEGWNLTISTQSPGGVSAGQPSWTQATNTWEVEGRAAELLPLLADHAEASGWTVVSQFCGVWPLRGSLTAAKMVDGDVASASIFVSNQDSLVVRVQIGLEMPPIDQEGIQRGADVSPPLDRAGTCLDPDFDG